MLLISFLAMAVGIVGMLMLPQDSSSVITFTVLFIIVYVFYNVNYAQTWAMMDEGAIPERLSGSAAGLISTVGYLPEIFISVLAGVTLDKYPGVEGYQKYFTFVVIMLLIGAALVCVWMRLLKKKREKEEVK